MKSNCTLKQHLSFIAILGAVLFLTTLKGYSQSFGHFASAIKLDINNNSQYYNTSPSTPDANSINPAPGAPFFSGNLGTVAAGSGLINLKGGEMKTYKNGGANVCAATLFYRVFRTGDLPPAFTPVSLPFFSNCAGSSFPDSGGGPCSGNDQKWGTFSENIDLTNRCPGDYTFEIYYTIDGSNTGGGCESTVYDSNGGNNYVASFTLLSDLQATATSNSSICEGTTLLLNSSPTGGTQPYTYSWSGPLGFSSTEEAPSVTDLQNSGSGTYSVLVTDGCNNVSSSSTEVVMNSLPNQPEATVTNPTCNEPTGTISIDVPTSGVTYSFDNGSSFGIANSSTGLAPGNYQVNVKDTATGCESESLALTVANALLVPTAAPSSNSPQCSGGNIQLTAADAGTGAQYSWAGPNGFVSLDQNPQIPFSVTALGTYALTVTSTDGCTAEATTDVTCSALPVRLISFDGKVTENTIQLIWKAVDASGFSYFQVERGSNPRSFEVIGRLNYDSQKQLYSLKDTLPLAGINYYRLKMVDLDGSSSYSKAISLKSSQEGSTYAYLENPVHTNQIRLFTNINPVSAFLIYSNGKEGCLKLKPVGKGEWIIEAENVPDNQISLIKINGESSSVIRKVIKTR